MCVTHIHTFVRDDGIGIQFGVVYANKHFPTEPQSQPSVYCFLQTVEGCFLL